LKDKLRSPDFVMQSLGYSVLGICLRHNPHDVSEFV
jgi:hypothetical protein